MPAAAATANRVAPAEVKKGRSRETAPPWPPGSSPCPPKSSFRSWLGCWKPWPNWVKKTRTGRQPIWFACRPRAAAGCAAGACFAFRKPGTSSRADTRVHQALRPCAGALDHLLRWRFDTFLTRNQSGVAYIEDSQPQELKVVTTRWWESLPEHPSERDRSGAVLHQLGAKSCPRCPDWSRRFSLDFPRGASNCSTAARSCSRTHTPANTAGHVRGRASGDSRIPRCGRRGRFDGLASILCLSHGASGQPVASLTTNDWTKSKLREQIGEDRCGPP